MRFLRHLQVLIQHWSVLWIHTVVDDLMRTLDWTLTTQVSNTVLCDDDLHRVLAVVVVANHWRESRDSTTLSGRWSSIDTDICVAGKVARTTDTVHHLGTANVGRVDVTENICFESGVDGNQTKTTSYLRVIGDLLWTENEFITEEIEVVEDLLELIRTNSQ